MGKFLNNFEREILWGKFWRMFGIYFVAESVCAQTHFDLKFRRFVTLEHEGKEYFETPDDNDAMPGGSIGRFFFF